MIPEIDAGTVLALGAAAFMAGVVDAVGGGGGLIQVPALLTLMPGAAPATLLGTNKVSASVGTAGSAWRYVRAVPPAWPQLLPALLAAFVASMLGALLLLWLPSGPLRLALPVLLTLLWIYTALGETGLVHAPRHEAPHERRMAALGAGVIGGYDGFLGPGAGAFYKLLYVRGLGYDFLHAAAPAKLANVASNLGALVVLIPQGQVIWVIALGMAVCNFAGGQIGSRIGLRHGSRLIRRVFLGMMALLILKSGVDAARLL